MELSRKIIDSIAQRPQETVMIYPGKDISGEEFLSLTASCAFALKEKGIRPGEWVAVCSFSAAEAAAAAIACHHVGAAVMMISPGLNKDRIHSTLCGAGVRLIFVHEKLHGMIRSSLEGSSIETEVILSYFDSMPKELKLLRGFGVIHHDKIDPIPHTELVTWKTFTGNTECNDYLRILDETEAEADPEACALLVWSSGSSGEAKGIMLSEKAVMAELDIAGFRPFTNKGTAFAVMQNMWSATSYIMLILVMLVLPRKIIIPTGQSFADMIAKQKADMLFNTGTEWMKYTASGALDGVDMSDVRFTACGGERITPAAERAVNSHLTEHGCPCDLENFWGLSEFSALLVNYSADRKGSVGRPFPEVRIEAFDPDHPCRPLERGQIGELFVISPAVMSGYYNDEEATKAFFFTDEDGNVWGRTGDAGRVDDDGFVYVYGRRDSAFCPDGVHAVYPSEIENVLAEDTRVLCCAVVLNNEDGAITAHIQASLQDEAEQDKLEDSLRDLAGRGLAEEKRPARYVFWPKGLPINECGKTDRRKLERY